MYITNYVINRTVDLLYNMLKCIFTLYFDTLKQTPLIRWHYIKLVNVRDHVRNYCVIIKERIIIKYQSI